MPVSKRGAPDRRRRAKRSIVGRYYFLDMGHEKYGDCVLCSFGDKRVLIDGGHPSDFKGQSGYQSIPEQLGTILSTEPPFELTLLVVTHAHLDHIGALPKMVDAGLLKPEFALVADPDLGFPPGARDAIDGLDQLDPSAQDVMRRAMAGLAEEDYSDLPDPELDAMMDAAAKLGARYRQMLDDLEAIGTKVIRWGASDPAELQPVYAALAGTGFDVIGPSLPHLQLCRDQVVKYARGQRDAILDALPAAGADAVLSEAAVYRAGRASIRTDATDVTSDSKGQGSALNCQSIVLTFGTGEDKVLLAADMQFALPEVTGLEAEMKLLRQKVINAGPYRLVKTMHHTSNNGLSIDFWRELGKPPLVVHSGGINDSGHPERGTLSRLEDIDEQILFARTDHNGLITVDLKLKGDRALKEPSRGRFDDYVPNRRRREDEPEQAAPPQAAPLPPTVREAVVVQTQPAPSSFVEVTLVRIPYENGRVVIGSLPIDISGRGPAARAVPSPSTIAQVMEVIPPEKTVGADALLGNGRDLRNLLFVTHKARLASNIGAREAEQALAIIRNGHADLIEIDGAENPESLVREKLAQNRYVGVVLVGGYDVVPSQRVDVLGRELRAQIPRDAIREDRDEFIVWSDDYWGDVDGEGMPDFPVSRIPDGRSAKLVLRALCASAPKLSGRFGIRNAARPFAAPIFNEIPGEDTLLQSAPTRFDQIPPAAIRRSCLYFMLHGLDTDGARFWGDDPVRERVVEAVNTDNLPSKGIEVALAGCCWGALTVDQRAKDGGGLLSPKPPEASMALTVLLGGATAFIGSTGIHYSPGAAGNFFGGPMHREFWRHLTANRRPPAAALFDAKRQFLADMPHGRVTPLEIGIERKIYKEFTCLGLGW